MTPEISTADAISASALILLIFAALALCSLCLILRLRIFQKPRIYSSKSQKSTNSIFEEHLDSCASPAEIHSYLTVKSNQVKELLRQAEAERIQRVEFRESLESWANEGGNIPDDTVPEFPCSDCNERLKDAVVRLESAAFRLQELLEKDESVGSRRRKTRDLSSTDRQVMRIKSIDAIELACQVRSFVRNT